MPRPGPRRAKLQFRDDPEMIRWVRATADVEFPTPHGGNEAALLRTLIREARAFREHQELSRR